MKLFPVQIKTSDKNIFDEIEIFDLNRGSIFNKISEKNLKNYGKYKIHENFPKLAGWPGLQISEKNHKSMKKN